MVVAGGGVEGREVCCQVAEEDLDVEGLAEEVVDAAVPGLPGVPVVTRRGEHHDEDIAAVVAGADLLHHLEPVQAGHHEVEQDAVRHRSGDRPEPLRAVGCRADVVVLGLQQRAQQLTDRRVVVDHEHGGAPSWRASRHSLPPASSRAAPARQLLLLHGV
ncbi:MAG: hypothetical protein QOD70_2209 [Frankiales bacterium]|nr:hypothetical protein [Frankiales bacterium]